jgi:hypothetical protein
MNGPSRQAHYVGLLTPTAKVGDRSFGAAFSRVGPERRGREHK